LNTASEYDGSDSGARPDEAVSWGKIKADASPVKVNIYTLTIGSSINSFFFICLDLWRCNTYISTFSWRNLCKTIS